MSERKTAWVDPKSLKPDSRNPNIHSPEQIDRLVLLIQNYGWRHPLIVSNQTGLIVVGHGRLEAALKMGSTVVPVEYQDFKDEDEAYGFMVADNGIASWAHLDLGAISLNLADMDPTFNLNLFGLKDFQVDAAEKKQKPPEACPECGYVKQ